MYASTAPPPPELLEEALVPACKEAEAGAEELRRLRRSETLSNSSAEWESTLGMTQSAAGDLSLQSELSMSDDSRPGCKSYPKPTWKYQHYNVEVETLTNFSMDSQFYWKVSHDFYMTRILYVANNCPVYFYFRNLVYSMHNPYYFEIWKDGDIQTDRQNK